MNYRKTRMAKYNTWIPPGHIRSLEQAIIELDRAQADEDRRKQKDEKEDVDNARM